MDWTLIELEAIVADYLHMLTLELAGQNYNKTRHRQALHVKLPDRSSGSLEFKHCNISAVLLDLGYPYIRGYQPRFNYQALLATVVAEQLHDATLLQEAAWAATQQPAVHVGQTEFTHMLEAAPIRRHRASEPTAEYSFKAVKRDYLERETMNRSLGLAGEELVVQFEQWRLHQLGYTKLANRIELVSQARGDGLGYDVLSFEPDGRERFIEVKTTSFGRETPFYVSRGELQLSRQEPLQFHLYRLFDFRKAPRLFDLPGTLDSHCVLDPVSYRASFD
ncbi:DUF3883 domain-containing protein [Xylophilus sp. GW821-FHT01B05]